jgi:hypothetical protein
MLYGMILILIQHYNLRPVESSLHAIYWLLRSTVYCAFCLNSDDDYLIRKQSNCWAGTLCIKGSALQTQRNGKGKISQANADTMRQGNFE